MQRIAKGIETAADGGCVKVIHDGDPRHIESGGHTLRWWYERESPPCRFCGVPPDKGEEFGVHAMLAPVSAVPKRLVSSNEQCGEFVAGLVLPEMSELCGSAGAIGAGYFLSKVRGGSSRCGAGVWQSRTGD